MEGTILRQQVYEQLFTGEPFDMVFVTCNRKKGTGGELVSLESWMILHHPDEKTPQNEASDSQADDGKISRDPDHAEHGTVNVFNPANSGVHITKVHVDLIQFFNGKRVIN